MPGVVRANAGWSAPPDGSILHVNLYPELLVLPNPLHPAVVHFPVVLAVLIPLVAIGALWAIRSGARPMRAWGITTAVAAALALSAWVSVETGEDQGEKVEKTVGEARVDAHAEAGQLLLYTSAGVLAIIALGLMPGNAGRAARVAGAIGTLAVAGAAVRVGHSGGQLVYKYNAASAYATTGAAAGEGGEGASTATEKGENAEKGEKGEGTERDEKR
jgi:uncharacterized membrane protein